MVLQQLNSLPRFMYSKLFGGLLVPSVLTNLQVGFETLSQISQSNGVLRLCTSDGESCDQTSPLSPCLVSCSLSLLEKNFLYI